MDTFITSVFRWSLAQAPYSARNHAQAPAFWRNNLLNI